MERKEIKIWLVSGIAIEYEGKFLITQQAKGMWHEGKWAIPGGVVDSGLTLLENATKEAREEVGLDIETTGLLGIQKMELKPERQTDPGGLLVYFLFHGIAKSDKVTIQKGEISDYKWLTLEELKNFPKEDFRPVVGFVIKRLEEQRKFPVDIIQEGE